jgi:hypothetical protein
MALSHEVIKVISDIDWRKSCGCPTYNNIDWHAARTLSIAWPAWINAILIVAADYTLPQACEELRGR